MFSNRVRGEKAFAAKQKLLSLKNDSLKVKKYTEIFWQKESMQKTIIRKVTNNLNSIATEKNMAIY